MTRLLNSADSADPEAIVLDTLGVFVRVDDWLRGHEQPEAADLVLTLMDRVVDEFKADTLAAVTALLTIGTLGGVIAHEEQDKLTADAQVEVDKKFAALVEKAFGAERLAEHVAQRDPVARRYANTRRVAQDIEEAQDALAQK